MAAVPLHQRSQSHLQKVSAPTAVLQREGKITHPSIWIATSVYLIVCVYMYIYIYIDLNCLIISLQEIDEYIVQAKERSYETMVNFGKQGLSIAATAAVSAAVKASVSAWSMNIKLSVLHST